MAARKRNVSHSEGGPILVTLGRTTVRIYPRAAERGRNPCFKVADYSTGKRRLVSFPSEKDARAEAYRIAARLNAADNAGASMTGEDRSLLLRATELVARHQLDVHAACAIFNEAANPVGPHGGVLGNQIADRAPL